MADSITSTGGTNQNIIINGEEQVTAEVAWNRLTNRAGSDNGITSISYTNGDTTVTIQGEELEELFETIDLLAEAISSGKMPSEILENLCDNCRGFLKVLSDFLDEFAKEAGASDEVTPDDLKQQEETQRVIARILNSKTFSDFDMRELMKLLIRAFSEFMNSQRMITMNTITCILAALAVKIQQMEESRDENYEAAIDQAIGQLVSACLQLAAAIGSAVCSFDSAGVLSGEGKACVKDISTETQSILTINEGLNSVFQCLEKLAGGSTAISGLIAAGHTADAKTADIASATADKLLEILGKMLDENANQLKLLLDFINTLLKGIQELCQNAYNTEMKIVS